MLSRAHGTKPASRSRRNIKLDKEKSRESRMDRNRLVAPVGSRRE